MLKESLNTLKHSKTRKNYEPITVRSSKLKKYGYPLIGLLTVAAAAGGIAYVAKGF
jgi:hypothetical protein